MPPLRLVLALAIAGFVPLRACTIFVLTDADRTLFFNNEDWSNPATRLWFVPTGPGYLGCAYLGFDDGWAQGGLNTAGLAFDWVAGAMEKWEPNSALSAVRGNPAERMLEMCTSVDEAVVFFRTHWEPSFARARIMVADRTGASAIIGAKDGRLQVELAKDNRGFGYGWHTLAQQLARPPEPTVANGMKILNACVQSGETATKYSNVFDLKSGDIVLFPFPGRAENVQINLAAELAQGGHYYDLARIREQVAASPQPLLNNMKRFFLDEFTPVPDRKPAVTARIRALIQDAAAGTMRAADYTTEFWKNLSTAQKDIQAQVNQLGGFVSLALVERDESGGGSYRYVIDFEKARVLQRYDFDSDGRVAGIASEFTELKGDPVMKAN